LVVTNQCHKLENLDEEEIKFVFKTLTHINKPKSIKQLFVKGYSIKHWELYDKYLSLGFTENDIHNLDFELI
jgi:hypothetical protein